MTERGQKMIFGFAGLFRRQFRRFYFPGTHLESDIPRDLGKSAKLTIFIPQRCQNRFGVKGRTVFSNPQADITNVSLLARHPQIMLRLFGRDIVGGVETREIFSNNLPGGVALDFLGPGIPCRDNPDWVQHVNRVFFDAFYQEAELLLTRVQLFMCATFPGRAGLTTSSASTHPRIQPNASLKPNRDQLPACGLKTSWFVSTRCNLRVSPPSRGKSLKTQKLSIPSWKIKPRAGISSPR